VGDKASVDGDMNCDVIFQRVVYMYGCGGCEGGDDLNDYDAMGRDNHMQ
jgi:hypothetical protein